MQNAGKIGQAKNQTTNELHLFSKVEIFFDP